MNTLINKSALIKWLSLLFFITSSLNAQIEFMPVGTSYTYLGEREEGVGSFELIPYFLQITVLGDTLINGQVCRKVSNELNWRCDDTFSSESFMYEEEGQVYHWNKHSESFDLLYDFTKTASESWVVSSYCGLNAENCPLDSFIITVDSVSFVDVNDMNIQVQHTTVDWFSEGWGYGSRATIYEGIGALQHFFLTKEWWCITAPNYIRGLRCFDSPTDGLFTFYDDEGSCKVLVQTNEELAADKLLVFPNPAKDQLTIQLAGAFDVQLYNAYGHLLSSQKDIQETAVLATHIYPSGYYFIHIQQGSHFLIKKIIFK